MTFVDTLQHIATHCNTLQHTSPHCNTLTHMKMTFVYELRHCMQGIILCWTLFPPEHTVTHCNTLQHTDTHRDDFFLQKVFISSQALSSTRRSFRPSIISYLEALLVIRVAKCGYVLQYVAVCCTMLQHVAVCCSVLQCVTVCCSVLRCVAVCCSVLQCVAAERLSDSGVCERLSSTRLEFDRMEVCCSVLQSVAKCHSL